MPRFSSFDIANKITLLSQSSAYATAAMLSELMLMLRRQEYRLRVIEAAVDGWSVLDDGKMDDTALRANYEERLQKIQEACPWDDDNEEDSWFFTEEEANRPDWHKANEGE